MSLNEDAIYNLVYDFYDIRISFGYYNYGEYLPAIPKICSMFHVAAPTVRSALSMLEEKGYIQMKPRNPARVIYQADQAKCRRELALYFVPRMAGILDICASDAVFFGPISDALLCNLNEEICELIWEEIDQTDKKGLPAMLQFYCHIYGRINNGLLSNLFWEIIRYTHFPYLMDLGTQKIEETLKVRQACSNFEQGFRLDVRRLMDFCECVRSEYSLENMEQQPFRWTIYRQRPQTCYTLVSRIIRMINKGDYPMGSYLPSLPKMAKELTVSERTLRRSLSILSSLGITRSFQGKGTQVLNEVEQIEFERSEVKEGLRLYFEALQLFSMTVGQVAAYTLRVAKAEEREAFENQFAQMIDEGNSQRCFRITLLFLSDKCPLKLVRECYYQMMDLLAWGYSVFLSHLGAHGLRDKYKEFVKKGYRNLQEADWQGFAEGWKTLVDKDVREARNILSEYYEWAEKDES
ncbi:GntR family transcriptional regulator [Eisenbergiella sp.]